MGEMETKLKFKIIVSKSFIKKSKVNRTEWGNTWSACTLYIFTGRVPYVLPEQICLWDEKRIAEPESPSHSSKFYQLDKSSVSWRASKVRKTRRSGVC